MGTHGSSGRMPRQLGGRRSLNSDYHPAGHDAKWLHLQPAGGGFLLVVLRRANARAERVVLEQWNFPDRRRAALHELSCSSVLR